MKAVVIEKKGKDLSSISLKTVDRLPVQDNQICVEMVSSRINPIDASLAEGVPSMHYSPTQIGGISGAGRVVEVGKKVKKMKEGDEVFFVSKYSQLGAWTRFANIREQDAALIPKNLTVKEAGAVVFSLLTAYEAMQTLHTQAGASILIHGAGGGVGYIAVQIALAKGLRTIVHASNRDEKTFETMGVDRLINYKITDFYQELVVSPPDYVLDIHGATSLYHSLDLCPKALVSTAVNDPQELKKTGARLGWYNQWKLERKSRKIRKYALKKNVKFSAQVTAPNGHLLQEASKFVSELDFDIKAMEELHIDKIRVSGFRYDDVGKVLVFNDEWL